MASQGLTSADSGEPTGVVAPADALGEPKRMTTSDGERQESYECPTCGRDDFGSQRAMRLHHYRTHGESIAHEEFKCEWCGDAFEGLRCNEPRFCSQSCADKGRIYTDKPWTEYETLYELHVRGEKSAAEIAEQFGIGRSTVDKWLLKLEVRQHVDGHTCEYCGASYRAKNGLVNHVKSKHDSQFSTRHSVECENCGEVVKLKPAVIDEYERHFCGSECKYEWQRENQSEIDGWPPTGEDHPWWRAGERHPLYNGGRAGYGKGWNESKRQQIRERDGHECQDCGMTGFEHQEKYGCSLSVHHIIPARQFDDAGACNAPDNLVTLCKACHTKWEGIPLRPQ